MTIAESISRIRNLTKSLKQDNLYISDRLIMSLLNKHLAYLLSREDNKKKLMRTSYMFTALTFVELIEVDKIEAECVGLHSDCNIKRTKDKLPRVYKGYWGPLIRTVTSIDESQIVYPTSPSIYLSKTKISDAKYDTTLYYWYLNDYLYFPNLVWDGIKVEAAWAQDITFLNCYGDPCRDRQDSTLAVPEYLYGEAESAVVKDIQYMQSIPTDPNNDKISPNR